jgi:predicted transposase/invertase (TIGR01784 family)
MMDIDLLLKGKNYTQLKESFVIFVCKEDFFGENMPCYFFSNTCRDKSDLQLGDKAYKVIFNASAFENEKDVEKKSILEYIIDKKSTSEFTTKLDTLVEQTKVNEIFKGDYMAWGLAEFDAEQRGYKDGISEGIQQGAYEKAIETAKNLLKENISPEIIARTTGLSVDFLKTIK